ENHVDAQVWAGVLVPFLAQLFVRPPEFGTRFESRLDGLLGPAWVDLAHRDNTNLARLMELQRLYSAVMCAQWDLCLNRSAVPIITNDCGYTGTENRTGQLGYAFPLGPDVVVVLYYGGRRVTLDWDDSSATWWVRGIARSDLSAGDVRGLNRALALN